jgi:hypothetical protein
MWVHNSSLLSSIERAIVYPQSIDVGSIDVAAYSSIRLRQKRVDLEERATHQFLGLTDR